MSILFQTGAYLLAAIMALFMIATATTWPFAVHGVIVLAAAAIAAIYTLRRTRFTPSGDGLHPLRDRCQGPQRLCIVGAPDDERNLVEWSDVGRLTRGRRWAHTSRDYKLSRSRNELDAAFGVVSRGIGSRLEQERHRVLGHRWRKKNGHVREVLDLDVAATAKRETRRLFRVNEVVVAREDRERRDGDGEIRVAGDERRAAKHLRRAQGDPRQREHDAGMR